MKSRISTFLLVLLTALAIGAAAAATASAYEFVVEKDLVAEPVAVEGTSGHVAIETSLSGIAIKIECSSDDLAGDLEAYGDSTATISLTGCTVVTPAKCKVKAPFEAKLKDTLIESGGQALDEFQAASGSTYLPITFEDNGSESCIFNGETLPITGTQTCELTEAKEELVEHEIICGPTGDDLKLGGNSVAFTHTEKAKLVSSEKFGVGPDKSFTVKPSELTVNFGEVSGEVTRTVTYENEGPGVWKTDSFALTEIEGSTSVFKVKDECNGVYRATATCSVKITFKPKEKRTYKAKLAVERAPEITLEGSKK